MCARAPACVRACTRVLVCAGVRERERECGGIKWRKTAVHENLESYTELRQEATLVTLPYKIKARVTAFGPALV